VCVCVCVCVCVEFFSFSILHIKKYFFLYNALIKIFIPYNGDLRCNKIDILCYLQLG